MERLRRSVGHPFTQLGVALVLIVSSATELSETFFDDFAEGHLRASHGLIIVGLWQLLRTIPDLVEGIERYFESSKESSGDHEG